MIITNGKIITWTKPNEILEGQAILIRGDKIVKIDDQKKLLDENKEEKTLNANGRFVMPGLICAHTHFYGAFSRGLAIPGDAPSNFTEILSKLWWSLDKSLDDKSIASSAWMCIIDAVKHGTTTLFDHHASPNSIMDSLDVISDVVDTSGIRASLCYEVTDRDGKEKSNAGIKENVRFIQRIKSGNNLGGRLAGTFGLHASLTLSEDTLEKCRSQNPDDIGFHIHVAEDIVDQYDSIKKTGKRVVDRLIDHHILDEKTIVAHAVHVDSREISLLSESQSWVSHQPRSNMNNAVGIGNIESMQRAGVKVCLGNDGFSNTMWDEWKTAYLVHKLVNSDPRRMNGYNVVDMAIYQNSALASSQFGLPIGILEPGAQADIILVDYQPFTPINPGNLPWHILFGMQHSMIKTTIIAGKIIFENGEFINIDEEKLVADAMQQSKLVWKRYQDIFS